jgi:anaerobic magnesium-protoporphyrin IX monomethyl ester cyclase
VARVLLAHAHVLRYDTKQFAIGKPYPPLATLFAAAQLRALGHEVALFDPLLDEDTGGFATALDGFRPDVVVLCDDSFNWFTKMCLSRMRAAAEQMVGLAHARALPVIVAGHDAADHPGAYLDAGAAFVIVGEVEITLGQLIGVIAATAGAAGDAVASAVAEIDGLVFRDRGFVRKTAARKLLADLDQLPLPAWDLVDVERYRQFWLDRHGYFSLNLVTTRGCPYKCNWCAKPVYGNTYHSRSPANVVSEMRLLRDRYAPDHFWFCDDILGLKTRWLVSWAAQVATAGLATPFLCQTRVDLMTEENVRALHQAGCAEVWLGAESGAQSVLDAMDKGITPDETRAAVSRLRQQGIRIGLFLQFGYPGEGWPEIQATRALLRELAPDDVGISVSYPLPGTVFHERVKDQLRDKQNWIESNDLDPLVPGRFTRDFYQALSRMVHAELRWRRGARTVRALVADPLGLDPDRLRALMGLRHAGRWLAERLHLERNRRDVL